MLYNIMLGFSKFVKSYFFLFKIAIFKLFCRITEKTQKSRIFGYVIVKLAFFSIKSESILFAINYRISTINRLWMYIKMFNRVKYVTMQHDYCLKLCKWTNIFANSFVRIHDFFCARCRCCETYQHYVWLYIAIFDNFHSSP